MSFPEGINETEKAIISSSGSSTGLCIFEEQLCTERLGQCPDSHPSNATSVDIHCSRAA